MGKHVGLDFPEKHGEELREFYYEALMRAFGAADGDVTRIERKNGDVKIVYKRGIWRYVDEYTDGEPFSGETKVYHRGIKCFTMGYWGKVMPGANKQEVYDCLVPALLATDPNHPWRGYNTYVAKNGLCYMNGWSGDIEEFNGYETINSICDDLLYEASYYGGIVNMS